MTPGRGERAREGALPSGLGPASCGTVRLEKNTLRDMDVEKFLFGACKDGLHVEQMSLVGVSEEKKYN